MWQCLACGSTHNVAVTHCLACGKHNDARYRACVKCGERIKVELVKDPDAIRQVGGSVEVS